MLTADELPPVVGDVRQLGEALVNLLVNALEEMHQGGEIRLPKVFYYIIKYITPSILLFILGYWFATDAVDIITLKGADPEQVPYRWAARLIVLGLIILLTILVRIKHRKEE